MTTQTSPIGVISFPHLFTPRAAAPGADERYSLSLIMDKDAQATPEFKAMKQAVVAAAREKWGDKADGMIKAGQIRMPIRDAAEKSYTGYNPGDMFISPWSKQKPDVMDQRLQDVVESDTFPGMKGRITYRCFAYDTSGNKGVGIGLQNVQIADFTSDRLDGKKRGKDDFDQLDAPDSDQNTELADEDDLPF